MVVDGRANTEGEEDEEMNYQMHFDPYLSEHLNHRHHELLREMEVLRLEKQLRKHHEGSGPRIVAYFLCLTSALRPLRGTGTAGR